MMRANELNSREVPVMENRCGTVVYPYEFDFGANPAFGVGDDQFNPIARSLGDLVSAKQSSLARSLAQSAGVDENEFSDSLYGCEFNELSKTAARLLIGYLEERAISIKARLRLAG